MNRLINAAIFLITMACMPLLFRKDGKWNTPKGKRAFRFFTVQSNAFCGFSSLCLCLFPQAPWAWSLKYIGTAAVTVTMMTVFLFLAPSMGSLGPLLAGTDLFMHLVTPLLALVSFSLFEKRGMAFATSLLGMLPVLIYGPWYLYKTVRAPEAERWEDFYGFNRGGKWKITFAAMMAGTFVICLALRALQNLP